MGQVTIYLDQETERKLQAFLEGGNMSKSRWIASLIREKTAAEWPRSVARLAGAWQDFPDADELRSDIGSDSPREQV